MASETPRASEGVRSLNNVGAFGVQARRTRAAERGARTSSLTVVFPLPPGSCQKEVREEAWCFPCQIPALSVGVDQLPSRLSWKPEAATTSWNPGRVCVWGQPWGAEKRDSLQGSACPDNGPVPTARPDQAGWLTPKSGQPPEAGGQLASSLRPSFSSALPRGAQKRLSTCSFA